MTDLRTPENMREDEVVGEEELVAADDSIIGKAFVWSILVFVIIGAAIGAMVLIFNRPVEVVAHVPAAFVPPKPIESNQTAPPMLFTDITQQAGIDFTHVNGAVGDKLLPETMGSGCAFLDFDNDGDQDILLVNSADWPDTPSDQRALPAPTHALYQNDGTGRFTNITSAAGLNFTSYGMSVAIGDYDNDGFVDVFIANLGPNVLLRNNGDGTFIDATQKANIAGDDHAWSTSAGFFDYDNDGDLDLFVCNYVKWSRDLDLAVNYSLLGVGRAYGPPNNFEGVDSYLYRNDGNGSFTDVSAAAGIQVRSVLGSPMGKALGVVFIDLEQDGFLDIVVANDTVQNFLLHNQKDGTFKERGGEFGVAFDRNGVATGAMGIDAAQFRNDNTLGIVIGNFANEMSSLYVASSHPHQFTDEAIAEGIGGPTRSSLTFGAFFCDADLDGRLDLLQANGHIEGQINLVQPSQQYRQPAQLFWNAGPNARTCYTLAQEHKVGDLVKPIVGRGAAYADIDGDGDLDVLLTQTGGPPLLLRNDQSLNHSWIRIAAVGDGAQVNRSGIGARIEVRANDSTQVRWVMPTRSYLSQVELPVTFGLAQANQVDEVTVTWSDGTAVHLKQPQINTTVQVVHGQ